MFRFVLLLLIITGVSCSQDAVEPPMSDEQVNRETQTTHAEREFISSDASHFDEFDPTVYTNSIGMTFVKVPTGLMTLGDGSEHNPVRQIEITESLYVQTTEVTQGQWKAVMSGKTPWVYAGNGKIAPEVLARDDHPACYIFDTEADVFCKFLSHRDGVSYRLPTEEEWEYACLAGQTDLFLADDKSLEDQAWYAGNASDKGEKYAHQVAAREPNAWGIYDMYGNVSEWCSNYYHEHRCRRGSNFYSLYINDLPFGYGPYDKHPMPNSRSFIGFRVVCDEQPGEPSSPE